MSHVLVFAKAPREGFVKTRLARDIGANNATHLYRQLGRQVIRQLESLPVTVWFDPPEARAEMKAWLGDVTFCPQPAGDLGAKLRFAFDEHFRTRESSAVAIGVDAPGVNAALVRRAHDALCEVDVVLGPAKDGGYYLIGLSRMAPAVFERVSWSTSKVFAQTVDRCHDLGLRVRVLETLLDIDTASDARALGLWPP